MPYWAVRPKSQPEAIRIQKAPTAYQACTQAFGRPFDPRNWEAKDLGTRVSVIQSNTKRIALLTDPNNWEAI